MTAQEVIDAVFKITQDYSFTDASIISLINDGLKLIAGIVFVPELETNADVDTTTSNNVPIPDNYMRNLYLCYSHVLKRYIHIYPSQTQLFMRYPRPDLIGHISGVAVSDRKLYYQMIPGNPDTLTLYYHRFPSEISNGADTVDLTPQFAKKALVSYVCREIYTAETDVQKLNEAKLKATEFDAEFQRTLRAMDQPFAGLTKEITDELCLESYLEQDN